MSHLTPEERALLHEAESLPGGSYASIPREWLLRLLDERDRTIRLNAGLSELAESWRGHAEKADREMRSARRWARAWKRAARYIKLRANSRLDILWNEVVRLRAERDMLRRVGTGMCSVCYDLEDRDEDFWVPADHVRRVEEDLKRADLSADMLVAERDALAAQLDNARRAEADAEARYESLAGAARRRDDQQQERIAALERVAEAARAFYEDDPQGCAGRDIRAALDAPPAQSRAQDSRARE